MINVQASERRALLIDDDEDTRFFARAALEDRGFIVSEADGAERGLEIFGEMNPHVVVVDYQMPGMDGLECCRRLRARWPGPILMLSGREDPRLPALAMEAGADRFFRKPANWRCLAEVASNFADFSR
jgi:DNA-binding response OmpR family regulator